MFTFLFATDRNSPSLSAESGVWERGLTKAQSKGRAYSAAAGLSCVSLEGISGRMCSNTYYEKEESHISEVFHIIHTQHKILSRVV